MDNIIYPPCSTNKDFLKVKLMAKKHQEAIKDKGLARTEARRAIENAQIKRQLNDRIGFM